MLAAGSAFAKATARQALPPYRFFLKKSITFVSTNSRISGSFAMWVDLLIGVNSKSLPARSSASISFKVWRK